MADPMATASGRLEQLQQYLRADPGNEALRLDIADIAMSLDQPDIALTALSPLVDSEAASPGAMTLLGIVQLRLQKHAEAAELFRRVLDGDPASVPTRFNLAWALSHLGSKTKAMDLLDEATTGQLPQAAMLHLQLVHESGDLDAARTLIDPYLSAHPDYAGLLGAISVLALDIEEPDLAAECAARAGAHPDALSTLGTLALDADDPSEAQTFFRQTLALNDTKPRAWIGLGLADIASGQFADATAHLDHGASLFETHSGSWIAAGWAHVLSGDYQAARDRFETALALDRNFAECHGSLAVVDALDGQFDQSKARAERALGLDRACFSAALAGTLVLNAQGKTDLARRTFETAINVPMGKGGRTIAQSLSKIGLR